MLGGLAPFPKRLGGSKPIAAKWLENIKTTLGSAFTQENISIVGAENIALARLLAGVNYTTERLVNNTVPNTSYDSLRQWANRLGVQFRDEDKPSVIRDACAARYRAQLGPTAGNIKDSLDLILKNTLVNIVYFSGTDLDNPPEKTYWDLNTIPEYQSGTIFFDDVWSTNRCHILLVITEPNDLDQLLYIMNVQVYDLLDRLLPAYATWGWTLAPYDGFQLDIDRLDLTAF